MRTYIFQKNIRVMTCCSKWCTKWL